MSKSSTPGSLAPVSQAQNTPELADLFGELQVISSEQPASDAADASLASAIRDVDEQVGRLERELRPPQPTVTISPPTSLSLDSSPVQ